MGDIYADVETTVRVEPEGRNHAVEVLGLAEELTFDERLDHEHSTLDGVDADSLDDAVRILSTDAIATHSPDITDHDPVTITVQYEDEHVVFEAATTDRGYIFDFGDEIDDLLEEVGIEEWKYSGEIRTEYDDLLDEEKVRNHHALGEVDMDVRLDRAAGTTLVTARMGEDIEDGPVRGIGFGLAGFAEVLLEFEECTL